MSTILYIPHGGGPLPLMGDPAHQPINDFLTSIPATIPKPDAIILISAHWETNIVSVMSKPSPELLFDYSGFPEDTYHYQYPCAGHPELATEIASLLNVNNILCCQDELRDYDHGMFVPMLLMYPQADIPCIQLSLKSDLNPATHIQIGKALQPLLCQDNLLLLGSGSSFHNIGAIQQLDPKPAAAFDNWLYETCCEPHISATERQQRLINWRDAPGGLYSHPREEHLLPLHVCMGAASNEGAAKRVFNANMMGVPVSAFLW